METKKSPKADLEKTRFLFLEIGLVIAISAVVIAFEWSSSSSSLNEYMAGTFEIFEEEIIPVTTQEKQEPLAPPEPEKIIEIFEIVDDEIEINDEFILKDFEVSQDTEIEIMKFTEFGQETEEEAEEAEIFFIVEDMPDFRGEGQEGFRKYIFQNLKYPPVAAENGISGRVFVKFVVEPDGSVSNVSILRGIDPALDAEALRVVKSSPKWTPGKQRGIPVRVSFTFPILFVLEEV